ncbi:hypothetical protein GCM10010344_25590 [Streptomyces bluensis]|nr:hypothetical protein GCM10010344_25590 [Streptomyces bluensis]
MGAGGLEGVFAPAAPTRPIPSRGLPPPDPRFGLNGLVLKRRTGCEWVAGGGWFVRVVGCVGLDGLVLKRRAG